MDTQRIKQTLLSERERLRDLITEDEKEAVAQEQDVGELSTIDQHTGDHGTETFEQEKALSLLETHREEFADVETALEKLEDGTYGQCETCGEPIPEERLAARPAARFCLEHQEAAERELGIA